MRKLLSVLLLQDQLNLSVRDQVKFLGKPIKDAVCFSQECLTYVK